MSEMKFDEARIQAWKKEIDTEFDAVERVLKEVTDEITRDPIADDVVMNSIYEAGKKIDEAWGRLKNVFQDVTTLAESLFKNARKAFQDAKDKVDDFAGKIKN